ncbi:MAG TPA: class I SAM-dependent methyltransferase [Natronosporangium sp.]
MQRPPHRAGHGNRQRAFEGWHSRRYDFLARRLLRRIYRRLAADLATVAPTGGAVLDVGTGPGVLLVELARRRPDLRLSGVDRSADMITAASRNLAQFGDRASARVADVADLPFPDGSFDLITSSLSLHHWDDPAAAGRELARVLRPGGQLVIYDLDRAPFDQLTAALPGQPCPHRSPFGSGMPFFPKPIRYAVTIGNGAAGA